MISVIVGTNRPNSVSRGIGKTLAGMYRRLGKTVNVIDLIDMPLEMASPASYANKPETFTPIAQQVLESEGLVVIAGEYNGSYPGILKLFIDHLPFPAAFDRRPVSFVGLSGGASGGVRGVEHLQQVFGYRNALIFPERVFIPRASDAVGNDGTLLDDELLNRLERQAAGFVQFVEALHTAGLVLA